MSAVKRYDGNGASIEAAVKDAHMKIAPRPGNDLTRSKVVKWGMEFGGFVQATSFWAVVEEVDPA